MRAGPRTSGPQSSVCEPEARGPDHAFCVSNSPGRYTRFVEQNSQVTLILPRRNDSWIVAAASRSNYLRLLQSGVAIHEFRPGLLHAKTLTVDDEVSFMGSTNLDLRSFDLNFENNVLLQDAGVTAAVAARQAAYLAESDAITLQQVRQWPRWRRMWHNALAMLSPLL